MKLIISMATVLATFAISAQADSIFNYPPGNACGTSYHSDSFGRGIKAAILGVDAHLTVASLYWDEGCYGLGKDWVRRSLSGETPSESCLSQFKEGSTAGFQADYSSGDEGCFDLGFRAGSADLDIGARFRDRDAVGDACVDAYNQGVKDLENGEGGIVPDLGPKVAACYKLGHFEGIEPQNK